MLKIGEAAALYGVSNRTLRFWEDAGLLKSSRMENDYRYYDAQNLKRIEQILLLRKIDLPIRDIQRIFATGEFTAVVGALEEHLKATNRKADELNALGAAIGQLLVVLQTEQSQGNAINVVTSNAHARNEEHARDEVRTRDEEHAPVTKSTPVTNSTSGTRTPVTSTSMMQQRSGG